MIYRFVVFGTLINLLFCVVIAVTGLRQMSVGLWPVLMMDIVY
jgi:hypothetical protein